MRRGIILDVVGIIILLTFFVTTTFAKDSKGITISMPTDGQEVEKFGKILFHTDVSVKENEIPVVFIKDPINQWWPWLQARPLSAERKEWELEKVQYGVKDDRKQKFQIQILLLSASDIDDGVRIETDKVVEIEAGTIIKNSDFRKLRGKQQIKSTTFTVKRK